MFSISSASIIFAVIIFIFAMVFGFLPFYKKAKKKNLSNSFLFKAGEALAAGVFLGAALLHLIPDAIGVATTAIPGEEYPLVLLIAGISFLFFLALEHIFAFLNRKRREIHVLNNKIADIKTGIISNNYEEVEKDCVKKEKHLKSNNLIAISAVIALSVHSFFAGSALGTSQSLDPNSGIVFVIFIAIIIHKGAASFSLSITLNKSSLKYWKSIVLFLIFSIMTPLGVLIGSGIGNNQNIEILTFVFLSISAGTFLFLGTLHGLEKSILAKKCCEWKVFLFVILGFAVMAVVAIFT